MCECVCNLRDLHVHRTNTPTTIYIPQIMAPRVLHQQEINCLHLVYTQTHTHAHLHNIYTRRKTGATDVCVPCSLTPTKPPTSHHKTPHAHFHPPSRHLPGCSGAWPAIGRACCTASRMHPITISSGRRTTRRPPLRPGWAGPVMANYSFGATVRLSGSVFVRSALGALLMRRCLLAVF